MLLGICDKAYWGKGYGRDAVKTLLDYAFRLRNLQKVWLTVNGNTPRALGAPLACGFLEEGPQRRQVRSNSEYIDLVFMGILRAEWDAARSA